MLNSRAEGIISPGMNLPARHILLIPIVICKCNGIPLSKITKLSLNTYHRFDFLTPVAELVRQGRVMRVPVCQQQLLSHFFIFLVAINIVLSTCKINALANAKILDTKPAWYNIALANAKIKLKGVEGYAYIDSSFR